MKKAFPIFAIVLPLILSACASRKPTPAPSESEPQLVPEVGTTLPDTALTQATSSSNPSNDQIPSAITLENNGMTFHLRVGDSFLLNLGADVYDWDVTVADQNVFSMRMGVMVVKDAQGIYDALAPGTTTLTAVGNPKCLQASPPCRMPTILFRVTLVVE